MDTYRHYFDIDPEYFPAVNADVIKNNPDLWKKFYPHDTFVKLVKDIVNVLSRKQKLNIWVEGAYGTGKSHAVLTLKRLLDASAEETKHYFEQFNLDNDLLNKFLAEKESGKIVTVHRYGSSSIHSDNDLFLAMQESIEKALADAGITNKSTDALKTAVIKYLSDEENKQSFGIYVNGSYSSLFGGIDVDTIIERLKTYSDEALQKLMDNIFKVANEKNIRALYLGSEDMKEWIRNVIAANDLHALIFIWDEFTEYFNNNKHRLTGYQELLELSNTAPFCFIPVTHQSEGLISDNDSDKSKILGRFIKPYCLIELPENMAFKLMGAAMKKQDDEVVLKDWEDTVEDLYERTHDSRELVKAHASINDKELQGILPIHPYTACLLKYIASSFESNQRSMFDFIKNDRGDDIKGFQWFIDNNGPFDDNPLLTVDMLWGFFYDMGKEGLAPKIRMILDYYPRFSKNRDNDEQRVLKTVLLFQAMSLEVNDAVDLFLPTEKNLNYAFEGSDLDGNASKCAEKLVRDHVLFKRKISQNVEIYSVLTGSLDSDQIEKFKAKYKARLTSQLIEEGELADCITLPQDIQLRYKIEYAGVSDFDAKTRRQIDNALNDERHIYAVMMFAKNEEESADLNRKVKNFTDSSVVFIDCGRTVIGASEFEDWVEAKATSEYYTGKDNDQSRTYDNNAKAILSQWRNNIGHGQMVVYTSNKVDGDVVNGEGDLCDKLHTISTVKFQDGLERYKFIDNLWKANALKVGVDCGLKQTLTGTYKSANPNTNIENHLKGAWNVEKYWEVSPSLPISRTKISLDKLFEQKMKDNGRISIREIYDHLKDSPTGYLPCNITALAIGFLMKEHVNSGRYTWSDEISSDELTVERFKEMVEEVIKLDNTPNSRYKEKYIVTVSEEVKTFFDVSSFAFEQNRSYCSSVEATRERIRTRMKDFSFPIWTLKSILSDEQVSTPQEVLAELIDLYLQLSNNDNDKKSDNDIASEIGKKCMEYKTAGNDLKNLLNKEKCTSGMKAYLQTYKGGALIDLANTICDNGQYINAVRDKFNADAANWLWKQDTANIQIDDVICEYKIIAATNKIVEPTKSYKDAIKVWMEKLDNLRLSYQAIKQNIGELDNLLSLLFTIRSFGHLQEGQKETLLECINSYGEDFKAFYADQLTQFKKACEFYLDGLSDNDIDTLFKKVPTGCFAMDKATYTTKVDGIITEHKKQLSSQKLKDLWQEKTQTSSPYEWSNIHKMPILIMIDDAEISECRKVFDTINNGNSDENSIDKALIYLNKATFWDLLNSKAARDKAFVDKIIGNHATMLKDIDEVKTYLSDHIVDRPYNWLGHPSLNKKLADLAENKYMKGGYEEAYRKIDSMPADTVKQYLKELIKNNINVGMEIIKNN